MLDKKPYLMSLTLEQLNKTLKTSTSLIAFKHDIKQHYFNKLKKKDVSK